MNEARSGATGAPVEVPGRASLAAARPLIAVVGRELVKLVRQRGRFFAQMVRPLIWLLVIGAGLGAVMEGQGVADYQRFLVPGVLGMTMLFGAMLGALSTVYDKESGVMRLLIVAPIAHGWIVIAKATSAATSAMAQGLLLVAVLWMLGYLGGVSIALLLAGMLCTSIVCAAMGMVVATYTGTLENYAVMMNIVIFPTYFISGALYPVGMLPDYLRALALANPFTYGVDVLKHATLGSDAGAFARGEFALSSDFAAIAAFTAIALIVACLRFARSAACEPLVHPRGRGAR